MMRAVVVALLALLLAAGPARAQQDPPPSVSAPSAILVEASTGDVLFQRAATERRAIASTTKLMTALLTMEHAALSDVVPASDYVAAPIESKLGLRPGERLSVADLLRGLMLESANDAAVTLGEHVAGSTPRFVKLMNRRARELGLDDTHYTNPIGLDAPGNYSSARDLARLAVKLRRHSFLRKIADRRSATLSTGRPRAPVANRNTLLAQDDAVDGLKTGHTIQAGYVLVGTRTKKRVTLVSVVLGANSPSARDRDSLALLRWGAGQYSKIRPVYAGTVVDAAPEIRYRRGAELPLVTEQSKMRVVRAGARITHEDVGIPAVVEGPIQRGQELGRRKVYADGKLIAEVPIVSSATVPAADLTQRTKDWFTKPLALVLAGLVLGGTVLMARRIRRGPPRRRTPRSEPEAA
ncbi:MAG TPA: D-alanyl-D-alanine carboxypeptidase family protein [Solirubrobacteraceae bacterium]|nr:D-alanyl-D-alanine carboxypeptidase family protein [Solirubrobacteraceae bacterium]